jgi:hypothetical protein
MLFGREHIKADKFGAFILSNPSNLLVEFELPYDSWPLLSDAIALSLSLQRGNVNVTAQERVPVLNYLTNNAQKTSSDPI